MICLYKKIDGEVKPKTFTKDEAKEAQKSGWVDNPTDAEKPKAKTKKKAAE